MRGREGEREAGIVLFCFVLFCFLCNLVKRSDAKGPKVPTGSSGESVKVIGWLSERERLRESSGESVKVIGLLSERVELMPAGESVKVIIL